MSQHVVLGRSMGLNWHQRPILNGGGGLRRYRDRLPRSVELLQVLLKILLGGRIKLSRLSQGVLNSGCSHRRVELQALQNLRGVRGLDQWPVVVSLSV